MRSYTLLKYPWHTGHDYELAKLPHKFLYLLNTPRRWATSQRPEPPNIEWVSGPESKKSHAMILHLDQWAYDEPAKRFLFLRFRDLYQGPKIVILHGSNMADGCTSERMRDLTKGCHVVCNSTTAMKRWNLPNATFIRHGMTPREWPGTDYSQSEIVVVQSADGRHPAVRNNAAVEWVEKELPVTWVGRDVKFGTFNEYRAFLSKGSIFFNPSYASANPRTRTEAMLSGLAIVTTNSHGEDTYIQNGVNGFCSNDMDELRGFLRYLYKNPEQVRKIGARGRETAQKLFHIDHFVKQWNDLLKSQIG